MHKVMNQSRTFCAGPGCPIKVRGAVETTILSYLVSSVILVFPFLNAITAKVQNILPMAGMNLNITACAIAIAWGISCYVSSQERHTHLYSTLVGAGGLPAAVVALLALGKL